MIKADTFNEILLRKKITELALLQYKKIYKHGCHGPEMFDCSGFAWYIYNQIMNIDIYKDGYGLSTTTKIMTSSYGTINIYDENALKKDINLIKEGDIVFFHRQSMKDTKPTINNKYPGHCGIYLSNKKFIHCSRPKGHVIISNFDKNEYWYQVLVGSKDIISDDKILERIKR